MQSIYFVLFLLLSLLQRRALAQGLSVIAKGGNLSTLASAILGTSPPLITASPSLTQINNHSVDCNPCQIMLAWTSISRVYWYGSTIGLTLDTVSVVVNQYNNTAITTSSTIYGNVGSANASTITETQSLASMLNEDFEEGDLNYAFTSIRIGNATEGKVDGSVTIAYPTPYLAIDGFEYVSVTAQVNGCPPGQLKGSAGTCTCIMDTLLFAFVDQGVGYPLQGWGLGGEVYPEATSTVVSLTSTYYETLEFESLGPSNFLGAMNSNTGIVNSASFLNFLSAASVFKSYPALSSCAIYNQFNGPPGVMVPASALTATVRTTIARTGQYNPSTPKPASPVKVTTIPQTAEAPSPIPTAPAAQVPGPISSVTETPTDSPELPKSPEIPSPNSPEGPKSSPDLPALQPVAGLLTTGREQSPVPIVRTATQALPSATPTQGTFALNQEGPNPVELVPVLTFDGSTYQADHASHFVIAGQTVAPGGVITISGTPVAIGTDASIAVIGSSTQLLSNTFATSKALLNFAGTTYTADDSANFVIAGKTLTKGGIIRVDETQLSLDKAGTGAVIGTSTQLLAFPGITTAAEPVLTFAGSTYTADSSSDFVLNGQTLTKGGTITIDGAQLSYDEAGTGVVIGSSTQLLAFPSIIETSKPVLTFGGTTYTADSSSNFILNGQTLTKGGTVMVDGTRISYDEPGTGVIIGTSTQILSVATMTTAAEQILTFDGSTYTADSLSNFVVDGQTLVKGGVITVDGTRLSYDKAGTDVVIGTSTQTLSTTSVAAARDAAITFDGSTYYADTLSDFVIDGQTLSRGGVITVHGTPISYAAGGTDVVVGSSTEAVGLGGYIVSGFGGGPSATGVSMQFSGSAVRIFSTSLNVRFILGALAVYFSL